MMDLAILGGEQTTFEEMARRQGIPATMVPALVQTLARAGLAETMRGHGGGVRLARPAEEITVRQVLEALERSLRLRRCPEMQRTCPRGTEAECALRRLWEETEAAVLGVWERTTLAELAREGAPVAAPPAHA